VTAMDNMAAQAPSALEMAAPSASAPRDASPAKPLLRGWLHLIWFEASLVLGTLALALARRSSGLAGSAVSRCRPCGCIPGPRRER
jgi:hypothetical protein